MSVSSRYGNSNNDNSTFGNPNGSGFINKDELLQACEGSWSQIMAHLAPGLNDAIKRKGKHVPCPVHGGKDGFRLFKNFDVTGGGICNTCNNGAGFKDGIAVLCWYYSSMSFYDVLKMVADYIGFTSPTTGYSSSISSNHKKNQRVAPVAPVIPQKSESDIKEELQREQRRNDFIRKILNGTWKDTVELTHPVAEPARLYFARRGLRTKKIGELKKVRFHPSLPYFNEDQKVVGNYPAIICLVQNREGRNVTLHRIYLDEDGFKAPVDSCKKMMPIPSDVDIEGAAIRLVDIEYDENGLAEHLGVTEGFETALAVLESVNIPVWACINTTLLGGFLPPNGVTFVAAYGDQDRNGAGLGACDLLITNLRENGIDGDFYLPPVKCLGANQKSLDWLDMLNQFGSSSFPGNPDYQYDDENDAAIF